MGRSPVTEDSPRLRLSVLGIVALALFATLFARLWFLQVVGSPEYQLQAELLNTREISIEAPRGRILDAKGRVIVDNRVSTVVTLDRQELDESDDRDGALLRLAQELTQAGTPTKVSDLEARLVDPRFSPIEPVPVATDIDEELEVFLTERRHEFPGVAVERETVRVYPYGPVASHVLGYVGKINEEELEQRMGTDDDPIDNPKPYREDSNVGKTGVEYTFEEELRGTPGVREVEVDARGEILRTYEYTPPVPGNDIQLTIDLDVQMLTEQELVEGVEATRGRPARDGVPTVAPAASAVVLDATTGGIVAMASYPSYSPEEFVGGITTQRYEELKAQNDPFTNRAIAGQYAPGSTFKLVTSYAGLHTGLINPNTYFNAGGSYTVQNCRGESCVFKQPGGGNGSISIQQAITVSSDTFYYWMADNFWINREAYGETPMQDAAREFGLGAPTGVSLPYEKAGVLPTPERRAQLHEENPEAFPEGTWRTGDNVLVSIGQGEVLVTPLQLANAYATFANGGSLHQPNIVSRVLAPGSDPADPEVIRTIEPRVAKQLDFPPAIYQPMMAGFDGVTKSGTAAGAFEGFDQSLWQVGGKTGTAQVQNKADTALFVGFGPVSAPQYVAAVIIEEGGFGAVASAPVVRAILEPLAGATELRPALTLEEAANAPPPPEDEEQQDVDTSGVFD
jgi:penicillin-binding protein 2